MPLSNDGILLYSKEEDPENMPTAVLKKLAELMRKRRVEVYETNDVNIKVNKRMFKMM
jgi:beta-galactosidase GanA